MFAQSKCERIVARKITKSDHQPAKKQRVSTELCFLSKVDKCKNAATITSKLLNILVF